MSQQHMLFKTALPAGQLSSTVCRALQQGHMQWFAAALAAGSNSYERQCRTNISLLPLPMHGARNSGHTCQTVTLMPRENNWALSKVSWVRRRPHPHSKKRLIDFKRCHRSSEGRQFYRQWPETEMLANCGDKEVQSTMHIVHVMECLTIRGKTLFWFRSLSLSLSLSLCLSVCI